jgi:hypothetical protein
MSINLESLGLKQRPVRPARHRKLTEAMLSLLTEEARKRASLQTYSYLAEQTGLSRGSLRVLMGQLIREQKTGATRVHRGTDRGQLVDIVNGSEW